jgi:hypothetical protein
MTLRGDSAIRESQRQQVLSMRRLLTGLCFLLLPLGCGRHPTPGGQLAASGSGSTTSSGGAAGIDGGSSNARASSSQAGQPAGTAGTPSPPGVVARRKVAAATPPAATSLAATLRAAHRWRRQGHGFAGRIKICAGSGLVSSLFTYMDDVSSARKPTATFRPRSKTPHDCT